MQETGKSYRMKQEKQQQPSVWNRHRISPHRYWKHEKLQEKWRLSQWTRNLPDLCNRIWFSLLRTLWTIWKRSTPKNTDSMNTKRSHLRPPVTGTSSVVKPYKIPAKQQYRKNTTTEKTNWSTMIFLLGEDTRDFRTRYAACWWKWRTTRTYCTSLQCNETGKIYLYGNPWNWRLIREDTEHET